MIKATWENGAFQFEKQFIWQPTIVYIWEIDKHVIGTAHIWTGKWHLKTQNGSALCGNSPRFRSKF